MPALTFLIKPASSRCNMRCRYCFYFDEAAVRELPCYGLMSTETLEAVVQKGLAAAQHSCTFAFQGGEPTLVGLAFYKKLVQLQQKHNINNLQLHNAIQTNGLAINSEWAEFFYKNNFLVGLSMDGSSEMHDANRFDAKLNPSFARVLKAAKILEKHKVKFNILTVVTALTARHTAKAYNFFKKQGFFYQQYIPCLDPLEEARGGLQYSLKPEKYALFLKTLFDLWFKDIEAGQKIYIRYFENLVGIVAGIPPESCTMAGRCTNQYVIEGGGQVFPCDFYVLNNYEIGNINQNTIEEIDTLREKSGFLQKSLQINAACKNCKWYLLCRGGCRRDRDFAGERELQLNYFCAANQEFFAHAAPRLQYLAKKFGLLA